MSRHAPRWCLLAVLLALLAACGAQAPAAEKPNIVVLLADDLGRADCGFMGGRQIKTPHLDRLAAGGAVLDAFYVQPVCSPTRAAFLTGRYPMRHGLQVGVVRPWARHGLPLEERTLATALQEAGYVTAIVGKWHLGHFAREYLPTRRGFDHQYGHYNGAIDYFEHTRDGGFDWHADDRECRDEGYSTRLIGQDAARFVTEHAGRKPFFLYVPFNAVHTPHQAPPEYLKPYEHLAGERRKYAGMLAALDEAVGTIVESIEKAGVREQTLIFFCSDNGGPRPGVVSDNGKYRGGKGTLYEGGVRVAAFVNWPGRIRAGIAIEEPLHIVDLFPTFLKLAKGSVEQPLPLDGKDAWPALAEGRPSPHEAILLNTAPSSGAIRMGNWKLITRSGVDDPDGGPANSRGAPGMELFNLKDDPYEKNNLAETNPKVVQELGEKLREFARLAVPPKNRPKPKDFVSPKVWGE